MEMSPVQFIDEFVLFMIPGLCINYTVMRDHTLFRAQDKWLVNLMITVGHFNLPQWSVLVYAWVNIFTLL